MRKPLTKAWWNEPVDSVHTAVFGTVTHLRTLTTNRRDAERLFWNLYTNHQTTGLESTNELDSRFNLVAQSVDTAAAQIVQPRRPRFITSEADFTLQRQARKLTQVLEGQMLDQNVDADMAALFLAGTVCGTGHLYGFLDEQGKPKLERCLPGSVIVDPRDGQRENPYAIYYRVPVAREVLLDQYPSKVKAVESAEGPTSQDRQDLWLPRESTVDDVMCLYAFRRPTNGAGDNGRFVLCTSAGSLIDEDWNEPLPFVPYRWKHRPGSYYGIGLAEAGLLSQARYRRLEAKVERMQDMGSTAWVISDRANKVRLSKLTNEPYQIVEYDGGGVASPPTMQVFSGTPVDIVQEQERIREQFLAEQGISQLSAQGTKPAGLNSAVSQRTYQEITATRQKQQAQGFEDAYVELFKLLIRLNRRASKVNADYHVEAKTTAGRVPVVSEIDWSKVDLPENKYRVSCWPVSKVPSSVSGKQELVQEWIASGMTQRAFAQQQVLDQTLDTDSTSRLELADMDRTAYDLERIEDGFEVAPDPYVNMAVAADLARRAYVARSTTNAPEAILAAMRRYVDACIAARDEAAAQAAPPAPEGAPLA